MTTTHQQARSFDAWASEYDRYRPGYPDELFDGIAERLALPAGPDVADLGAGTGRASLAMARRGWRVTAVEPGRPMLDVLRARAADDGLIVATIRAEAEATGIDAASIDLATAAQAFHWFDRARALAEMARIVRPGGGIALFWNVRDADGSALLSEYDGLLGRVGVSRDRQRAGRDESTADAIRAAGGFGEPAFFQVRHVEPMAAGAFIGLAFTASYVQALEPAPREEFARELAALVDRHSAGPALEVPYIVDCWTARRNDA